MKRIAVEPRENWRRKIEETGLSFHDEGDTPWWHENACYEFDADQIDELDNAANELHELCLSAVQHVIVHDRFNDLSIPRQAVPVIEDSWRRKESTLYGRFDFVYDGVNPPRLLEYNADTPTSLLEASVTQWFWLQELFPDADQFNSIHERLQEYWQQFRRSRMKGETLYFVCVSDHREDLVTTTYLQDTANGQGFSTERIFMEDIGWDAAGRRFADLRGATVESIFKLYPWEWLVAEEFGPMALEKYREMCWIEPIWKMILSNKGILPILWELNPGHPNLLEAYFDGPRHMKDYVRKPKLSREGANITIFEHGRETSTSGTYGSEGYIYQALAELPDFDGNRPVLGCWIIGGESAGMGIRETPGPITYERDRFVPHLFR